MKLMGMRIQGVFLVMHFNKINLHRAHTKNTDVQCSSEFFGFPY